MIKLINNNTFSSKCDLIIIPCNNFGGVTVSTHKELKLYNLPYPYKPIPVGSVQFIQNTSIISNALTIGYAASVDATKISSSENILRVIMKKIMNYCHEQSLQKVNIPLLGTGAGGLTPKTSYTIMKEEFEQDTDVLLCVYVLSSDIYNELINDDAMKSKNVIKNPRVFISYTGADETNSDWVKNLACRLRECGVNTRLDMFHLKPGQDLPQWMTNELIMADKVLLICDKYYAERANNRHGGVGWETMIIQGDMLCNYGQNKYLAIVRDDDIDHSLPIYIKSKYALNWTKDKISDKDFNELLLYLFDCDTEPPIGEIPSFIKQKLSQ